MIWGSCEAAFDALSGLIYILRRACSGRVPWKTRLTCLSSSRACRLPFSASGPRLILLASREELGRRSCRQLPFRSGRRRPAEFGIRQCLSSFRFVLCFRRTLRPVIRFSRRLRPIDRPTDSDSPRFQMSPTSRSPTTTLRRCTQASSNRTRAPTPASAPTGRLRRPVPPPTVTSGR